MKRNDFFKLTATLGTAMVTVPTSLLAGTKRVLNNLKPRIVRNSEGKTVDVIGDRQTFKLTGKDTNGLFTLIEEENEPGTGIPPHVHAHEDEVFKVIEGEMELTVGDQTTILKSGDLAFGPRGVPHSWKIVGDSKAKVILSVFPAGIEDMFEELGELPPGPPDFPVVAEICGRYGIRFIQ
ncbi:MAG: quercetin 2,3-dioxygenase [Flavobacteriaceae bacterium]